MTPEQQFKEVVQVLRGMSLHGCADTIENAWEGLKSNHERVVSAYQCENIRMRAELKRLGAR